MDNHFLELVQALTGRCDLVGTTFVATTRGFLISPPAPLRVTSWMVDNRHLQINTAAMHTGGVDS